MSKVNMVLFMDKVLDITQKRIVLKQFHAIDQGTEWLAEKNGGCLWIEIDRIEDGKSIWEDIKNEVGAPIQNVEVQDAIFVQPSREVSTDCFALDFCQAFARVCEGYCNVYFYHEFSGLYKNEEINYLRPMSGRKFYNKRKINKNILKELVENVLLLFTDYLDIVQDDDDEETTYESAYILMFKYLFGMRDEIEESKELADNSIAANLKKADEKILEILYKDYDERLLLSYCYRLERPIKNWWWHLEKVKSGDLIVNLEEGYLHYHNCKIAITY